MRIITLISMMFFMSVLSGCASDGNNATMVRGTSGSNEASQASARTIAPITSYINTVHH